MTPSPSARPAAPGAIGRPTGRAEAGEKRVLQLGKGISIQGSVTEAERIVIEGTMESQLLQCQELAISHSGVFKGEVQVEDADIAGVFDGTLIASGSLTIRATGRVLGVARARRLSVEDGGQLTGRMEMISDTPSSTPMPVAPPVRAVESSDS
jgi:cytoskeletal protein CcmA (bactofilin family)